MQPNKWEIWLVNMPFEEGIGSKVRPVLVIRSQEAYIFVGKMTTHPPRKNFPYEYELIDWKRAGLSRQTTLRLSKIVKLEDRLFIRRLGVIQPVDQLNVRAILSQIQQDRSE